MAFGSLFVREIRRAAEREWLVRLKRFSLHRPTRARRRAGGQARAHGLSPVPKGQQVLAARPALDAGRGGGPRAQPLLSPEGTAGSGRPTRARRRPRGRPARTASPRSRRDSRFSPPDPRSTPAAGAGPRAQPLPSPEGTAGSCRRRKPPDRERPPAQSRRDGRTCPQGRLRQWLCRPFGTFPRVAFVPAAEAAGKCACKQAWSERWKSSPGKTLSSP